MPNLDDIKRFEFDADSFAKEMHLFCTGQRFINISATALALKTWNKCVNIVNKQLVKIAEDMPKLTEIHNYMLSVAVN